MSSSKLFQPLKIGRFEIKHRVAMAPLTRFRNDDNHVPRIEEDGVDVCKYYEQRASVPGTLIITEGTLISDSPLIGSYDNAPGIWTESQIKQWHKITDAVHAKGSYIFMQLWAIGRVRSVRIAESVDGAKKKGFSLISQEEGSPGPDELTGEEIMRIVTCYGEAAKNAIEAGFDGVEILGANGYLADQFLQDVSNHRTDIWGGSIEKRARFGLEVVRAAVRAVGAERVAYRISPYSVFRGMLMDDPIPQFTYMVQKLRAFDLAYLHISMSGDCSEPDALLAKINPVIEAWGDTEKHPILVASDLTPGFAYKLVDEIHPTKNIIPTFGRAFLANPDLPFRIRKGLSLNEHDVTTHYTKDAKGYTDYPFSQEFCKSEDSYVSADSAR